METEKNHINFGEHIRTLRETAGLTLREVSSTINIDSSLLAKIEKNKRPPSRLLIKNLSYFYKIDEKELLTDFLSDQIAYRILEEAVDLNILKVAEEKVTYFKTIFNGNNDDKK